MSRARRNWTPAEDQILIEAMARADRGPQPLAWHIIAQSLKDRTNKDCRKRWYSKLAADVNKGPWLPDEDSRLYDAVQIHGSKWVLVASQVGTRNGDQCSKRWNNTINPEIDHSSWMPDQDELLLWAVGQVGHNWTKIVSDHFVGRTPLAAKNRYYLLSRKFKASLETNSAPIFPSVHHDIDVEFMDSIPIHWKRRASLIEGSPLADVTSEGGDSDYQLEEDGGDESCNLGSGSRPSFASSNSTGYLSSTESLRKETYSDTMMSNEVSKDFASSSKGESGYSPTVQDFSNPQHIGSFGSYTDANLVDLEDFMIENIDLNSSNTYPSGFSSPFLCQNLAEVQFDSASHQDSRFQGTSQDGQQTMNRRSQIARPGGSIAGQSLVQSSSPREICDNVTRRVTITAICSADQLGDLLQAVTERTISAQFETGN